MKLHAAVKRTAPLVLLQLAIAAGLLGLWQWSTNAGHLNVFIWSQPSRIWDRLQDWWTQGSLLPSVWATLWVLCVGYLASLVVGVALGVLSGVYEWVRSYLDPFLALANAVPRAVLFPVFIVVFGFGPFPKVLFVFSVTLVLVIIDVSAAIRDVPKEYVLQAQLFGGGNRELVTHVYLPAIASRILASARVTVGYAFQAIIVAELFGAVTGLGGLLIVSQENFDTDGLFAAIALMGIVAVVLDLLLQVVERRANRWMRA